MKFSYPDYLDKSVISELENYIITICNQCHTYEEITAQSSPLWEWASLILAKTTDELRHQIETHEADEHFSDKYHEEKDHLLKLPLLILEKINS